MELAGRRAPTLHVQDLGGHRHVEDMVHGLDPLPSASARGHPDPQASDLPGQDHNSPGEGNWSWEGHGCSHRTVHHIPDSRRYYNRHIRNHSYPGTGHIAEVHCTADRCWVLEDTGVEEVASQQVRYMDAAVGNSDRMTC